MFAQPNGNPIDPRADHVAWKALLTDAQVRPARLHDGRHTAATSFGLGVPPHIVQEIVGHAHLGVTMGIYAHVSLTEKRTALDRLQEGLS